MKTFLFMSLMLAGSVVMGQVPPKTSGTLRKVPNTTFQPGEKLEFRVHYGSITAGTAMMYVDPKPVMFHNRPAYHIIGQGISSKSFSLFFKVNDRYETYMDQEALVPWKFKRKIDEGGFREYTEVDFDQFNHTAVERKNNDPNTKKSYTLPVNIQDVMSAFYFARTQDYTKAQPGDTTTFQNFIDQKVFDLDVLFLGREVITVDGVKYRCVKLKPLVREGGLFRHQGDMFLWISDDLNRIPIRVEAGLVVGSVQVDFMRAEGLRHPLTARVR